MLRFVTALILVAAVPFAIYVWPTKYAYDQIKLGESQFPIRIHRVTGYAEQLTPAGWQPLSPAPAQTQTDLDGRPVSSPSPSGRAIITTPTPARSR
jgi:hypothetical protein